MQTILGANGVIGRELSASLGARGLHVRQVGRSPRRVNERDELVRADLRNERATRAAVAGSDVAYLVAGLRYDAAVWEAEWPRIMDSCIDACIATGARLVFFDNVYAYGAVNGPMTEDTPFNPTSRKGVVRARIALTLLDAMHDGAVEGMIVRAADFYGPGAVLSFPHATVFERIRRGRTPQWVGDPSALHSFTYTPDAGAAVAALGQSPSAFGRTWHLPTSSEPMTGQAFVRTACEAAGRPYALQAAPAWMLRLMGAFVPVLRENREMMYQFERDYVFDSSRIERQLGLRATPYREGIGATLAAGTGAVRAA